MIITARWRRKCGVRRLDAAFGKARLDAPGEWKARQAGPWESGVKPPHSKSGMETKIAPVRSRTRRLAWIPFWEGGHSWPPLTDEDGCDKAQPSTSVGDFSADGFRLYLSIRFFCRRMGAMPGFGAQSEQGQGKDQQDDPALAGCQPEG
jgi:hypothetical protein